MENKAVRFDLTLLMEERVQGLKGSLEYNSYLFDRVSIAQMMESYQVMLEALVAHPDQSIWDLPLLAEHPIQQPEIPTPQTTAQIPPRVHEIFEFQAARTPTALAVSYEEKQLTYQELNQRANQVAQQLRHLGVQPHTRVGIMLERSLDVVVSLLGILKVAGIYVPLEVGSQPDAVIEDAHIQFVVTRQAMAAPLQQQSIACLCLDTIDTTTVCAQIPLPESTSETDKVLSILYQEHTSSAERIYQDYEQISNFLNVALQKGWNKAATVGSVWSACSSALFLYELLLPLTTGGLAQIVPEHLRLYGQKYCAWLAAQQITSAYLPAALLPDLVTWVSQGQQSPLQLLFTQADAFPEHQLFALQQRLPRVHILNGYGSPEAGSWTTMYEVHPTETPHHCTPIGCPIDPTQICLLDHHMQPVPRGAIGEMYITRAGIARGYFHNSTPTVERTLTNPPGSLDEHLYKTGDWARFLADGNLELIGRGQQYVECQGMRIWPAEVTALLIAHQDVHQAVVLARESATGVRQLVAYVVPKHVMQGSSLQKTLQAFLKEQVPMTHVPAALIVVDYFPLNRYGEVIYAALPESASEPTVLPLMEAAPRSKLESEIAAIWCQILKLEHVGVEDNFFDRGGHSLLMIRLHNELQVSLKRDVSILDLFKYPTIRTLATYIQQEQPEQQLQEEAQQIHNRTDRQKEALQRQKALMKERRNSHGTH
jgi:non-ribosomal peptide synthetase component F/acyl carrier protein